MWTMLFLNLWQSSCLCLLSAAVIVVSHYTWLLLSNYAFECFAWMYGCCVHVCAPDPNRSCWILWNCSYGCELLWVPGTDPGFLEEKTVLLTADLSLYTISFIIYYFIFYYFQDLVLNFWARLSFLSLSGLPQPLGSWCHSWLNSILSICFVMVKLKSLKVQFLL